jgi:hypothetical protein
MRARTYRVVVVGSILSSFMLGFHLPAIHNMVEHGNRVRIDVLLVTVLFAIGTVAGLWALLRAGRNLTP